MKTFPEGLEAEWLRFEEVHARLQSGLDLYEEIFKGATFPLQRKHELRVMMEMARLKNPRVVMEIGSDKGGGFYHWIKCLPTVERAIALEFRGIPFGESFARMFPGVDLFFAEGSSYDSQNVAAVRSFLNAPGVNKWPFIDCLFIDGDKNGTQRDYEAYLPMMAPGGLIFIHDINPLLGKDGRREPPIHPETTFYSLAARHRIMAVIDGREASDALELERSGQPPADAYEQWLRVWKWGSCGVGVVQV